MKKKLLLFALTLSLALVAVSPLAAQDRPILQGGVGTARGLGTKARDISLTECLVNGNCGAEHIFILANNIIRWMVGVSGALALFMYVIGGIWMIFSAGNQSRVERGKDILVGTTVSLIAILGGWLIINFVLTSIGTKPEFQLSRLACKANRDCGKGQTCDNEQCIDLCTVQLARTQKDRGWACQRPADCGINYIECSDAPDGSARCAKSLCPGEPEFVCCYR